MTKVNIKALVKLGVVAFFECYIHWCSIVEVVVDVTCAKSVAVTSLCAHLRILHFYVSR